MLSKFLLLYKTAGFKEIKRLNLLLHFLVHFSGVVFNEANTRSFGPEDKFQLYVGWIPDQDHKVTAVNIILFLIRRGFVKDINVVPCFFLKFNWKLEIVK